MKQNKNHRSVWFVLGLFAVAMTAAMLGTTSASATQEKVGICHRTGSESNPYVYIEVPEAQANGHITGDGKQHNHKVFWKTDGTWRGADHAAGDEKMDYYGDASSDCEDTTPTQPSETPTPTDNPTEPTPTDEPSASTPTDEPTSPGPSEPTESTTVGPPPSSPPPSDTTDEPTEPVCEPGDDTNTSSSSDSANVPSGADAGQEGDTGPISGLGLFALIAVGLGAAMIGFLFGKKN